MCRSVYLSGLLMSHGTDSVRTRRATTDKKDKETMKHLQNVKCCAILCLIAEGDFGTCTASK